MFVSILIILILCMGTCSSEGNIRLLEDEVMAAIQACKNEQCLSQCVFANLHVVDKRGIPHEGKFWNKIEGTIKSQKSRALLEDQIRTCFQNLRTETVENICSYSNELERCLMLRFSDRINGNRQNQTQKEILS